MLIYTKLLPPNSSSEATRVQTSKGILMYLTVCLVRFGNVV
jgi:hypothetical protein